MITRFMTRTSQDRERWIAIEGVVPVRSCTAEENLTPLRSLFDEKPTIYAESDSLTRYSGNILIARHPDSLQFIGHV
jgi:hypothetical protein